MLVAPEAQRDQTSEPALHGTQSFPIGRDGKRRYATTPASAPLEMATGRF
jgi:hypothetical protein